MLIQRHSCLKLTQTDLHSARFHVYAVLAEDVSGFLALQPARLCASYLEIVRDVVVRLVIDCVRVAWTSAGTGRLFMEQGLNTLHVRRVTVWLGGNCTVRRWVVRWVARCHREEPGMVESQVVVAVLTHITATPRPHYLVCAPSHSCSNQKTHQDY